MWIISKSRLREFWKRPACADSQGPLAAWFKHVAAADWRKWADLKADFSTADLIGTCVVFNIGGNKYRLVVRVLYLSHKVFILRVMTHAEYDQRKWEGECGCHAQPPQRKTSKQRKGA